jgi:hypothetical protein
LRALSRELDGGARKYGEAPGVVRIVDAIFPVDARAIVKARDVEQDDLDAGAESTVVDRNFERAPESGAATRRRAKRKRERRQAAGEQQTAVCNGRVARQGDGDFVA